MLRIIPPDWKKLLGAVVDGRFPSRTLTGAERDQAECNPELPPPESIAVNGRASRLPKPEVGPRAVAGDETLYIGTESPAETLADRLRNGPLPEPEVRDLLIDVIGRLRRLHGSGLVCRSVEPYAIVRAGTGWQLAPDSKRMCAAGSSEPPVAFDGSRYIPPEAYEGVVVAASDVWSLGVLMTEALTGTTDPLMLSKPFDGICRRCFETDPRKRPTLEEIEAALGPRSVAAGRDSSRATGSQAAWPPCDRDDSDFPVARQPKRAPREPYPLERTEFPKWAKRLAPAVALLALAGIWLWRTAGGEDQRLSRPAQAQNTAAARERAVDRSRSIQTPAGRSALAATRPRLNHTGQAGRESRPAPHAALGRDASAANVAGRSTDNARNAVRAVSGRADFTSDNMNGRRTASGGRFDNGQLTAAHPTYPFGTRLKVTNLDNGRSVVVTVNDRCALRKPYVIRLTQRAATQLDFRRSGSAPVSVEVAK